MKNRNYILVAILFAIPQIASSQAAILAMIFGDKVASENFNLSLEVGVPFNSYSNIDNSRIKTGVNFGIGGNVKLSDNWFVSPNIYFLSKRNLYVNPHSLNTGNTGLDPLYSDMPVDISVGCTDLHVLIAYQPTGSNIRLGISPQVSFLGNSTATYDGDAGVFIHNIEEYTNKLDYGIMANVGYIFKKGNHGKGIHLNLRYYHGFNDIFTDNYMSGTNNASYFAIHFSLPFITEELAAKNLQ